MPGMGKFERGCGGSGLNFMVVVVEGSRPYLLLRSVCEFYCLILLNFFSFVIFVMKETGSEGHGNSLKRLNKNYLEFTGEK
jgi:hypothetical protein